MRPDIGYIAEMQGETRLIKIGRSYNPKARVASIQTNSPFRLRLVAVFSKGAQGERELKQEMAEFRESGEWYRPNFLLTGKLRQWRAEGRLLRRLKQDQEYFNQYVVPAFKQVVGDRVCANISAGDLLFRILNNGIKEYRPRLSEIAKLKSCPSVELLHGYLPLPVDEPIQFIDSVDLINSLPDSPASKGEAA